MGVDAFSVGVSNGLSNLSNVLVTMASLQSSHVCSPCFPIATLTTAIIVRDICRVSGFIAVNFSTNVVEIW